MCSGIYDNMFSDKILLNFIVSYKREEIDRILLRLINMTSGSGCAVVYLKN